MHQFFVKSYWWDIKKSLCPLSLVSVSKSERFGHIVPLVTRINCGLASFSINQGSFIIMWTGAVGEFDSRFAGATPSSTLARSTNVYRMYSYIVCKNLTKSGPVTHRLFWPVTMKKPNYEYIRHYPDAW